MLSWFRPKYPLSLDEKLWIESRMRWLSEKLGVERLLEAEVILPEPRYFPDPYAGEPADARRIFERVCGYMKLDPTRFDLAILPDESIPNAVGLYFRGERPRIVVAQKQLADPERLVATIAHELSHDILLGGGLITVEEPDHEYVTDLLPVFLGLGLFAANSPVRALNSTALNMHYFRIDTQGYLSSRLLGYALSLFAHARGEVKPAWARHLRPDAAQPFRQGLRYLRKTGDTLFQPETANRPITPTTEAELLERLTTGSLTVRVKTLWDISKLEPPPVGLVDGVIRRVRDDELEIRIEAVRLLPSFGRAASGAIPDLLRCLASPSAILRTVAMHALPTIGTPADRLIPALTLLLDDGDLSVADAAAASLGRLGPSAAAAAPSMMDAIRTRVLDRQPSEILSEALIAIAPPEEILKRILDSFDLETGESVRTSLRKAAMRRNGTRSRDLQGF